MNFREIFFRFGIRLSLHSFHSQRRTISFYWITKIFNAVDEDRVNRIGPNLACAEWLLRNGASVRFKGDLNLLSDYNKMIDLEGLSDSAHFRIEEIYAKKVLLNDNGFEHFKNCNDILKMTFIYCPFGNEALAKLGYVKNSLQYLEMRSCAEVGDAGILSLTQLSNLKVLKLVNLQSVQKKGECETVLRKALPECEIDFQ